MQLLSWLSARMTCRPQTRRAPARKPTQLFRPRVEVLEGRDLPSTLTVMNNLDSGAGSLRAEIAAANPGDTINFATSLNGQTITLTSGELMIVNKSLSIQGPGAGQLAISGGLTYGGGGIPNYNGSRVFEVNGAGTIQTVTISGLTITDGSGAGQNFWGEGGAILNCNGSTLTVSNCTLSNSIARGPSGYGGAIANEDATLKVVSSNLSGNQALGGAADGPDGEGGAVYNGGYSTLSMTGCTLSNNLAAVEGGGIYLLSFSATISGCTFSGNVEEGATETGSFPDGNDIVQWSYSNGTYPGRFTLNNCVFLNNTAYYFDSIFGWWKGHGNIFN